MYVKKSIGRPDFGAGNPTPKSPTVIIIEADDINTFPVRTVGTTTASDGLTLKAGAKAIGVYATPATIERIQTPEGEADARGYSKGVKFEHPGDSTDIEDFIEHNANKNLIAITTGCDGGSAKIIGSPCNPLSMTAETLDNREGTKKTITLQQTMRDQFRILTYTGELPPVEGAVNGDEGA